MSWLRTYLQSSLGKKQVMAVSGLLLALFAAFHMASHLQVFISADAYNAYAHGMQSLGGLLWVARGGLLAVALVHIVTAASLVVHNRRARSVRYKRFKPIRSKFYSRTMALTGMLLAAFIVIHLLHFTTGDILPAHYNQYDRYGRHDVYGMMVMSFQLWWMSALYIGSMAFLCMHLAHGMSSWFQSLGLNHPKYNALMRAVGPVYGLVVFFGYIAVPIAVLAGVVQ